jgi:ethanolamine ammonia-lyase large subunit
LLGTLSRDRDDYILHPETGERLSPPSIGELLFEKSAPGSLCGILHIIGERPGTMNHSYSACITVVKGQRRAEKNIDHDITKLVCNIADTALPPGDAARETLTIIRELAGKKVNGSRRRNHS